MTAEEIAMERGVPMTAEEIALEIVLAVINKTEPAVLFGAGAREDVKKVAKTYATLYKGVLPIIYEALTFN